MGGEDAYDIANQKNWKMIRVYIYIKTCFKLVELMHQ